MIVVGIDVGGKNIHAVIYEDGRVVARAQAPAGINRAQSAEDVYAKLLDEAAIGRAQVERVVATGSAGKRAAFADNTIPDAAASAWGVSRIVPSARTVIDVGGEDGRAIKISPQGKVLDSAVNEKCAAGSGTFVEAMARALEMSVPEMAEISLEAAGSISINAQCAVFGESEVVSLIHANTPKKEIARAVHEAIASRIGSVARKVGLEKDIALIGGLALNTGFVEALKREIDVDLIVPDEPGFIGAIGAAISAMKDGE